MLNHLLSNSEKNSNPNMRDEMNSIPAPLRSFLKSGPGESDGPMTENLEVEAAGQVSSWFTLSDTDPLMPKGLTRSQRALGFAACFLTASLLICIALALLPIIGTPFGVRKYVFLHTLGSLLMLASFAFITGPWNFTKKMCCRNSMPFTVMYLLSLFFGLYAVLAWQSALVAIVALMLQLGLIGRQIMISIPGGRSGLSAVARAGYWTLKGAARSLPV